MKVTLVTLHGDTDHAAAQKRHAEQEILRRVPEDKRTEVPCDVVAVFKSDNATLELTISDWKDVVGLENGAFYELTIKKV